MRSSRGSRGRLTLVVFSLSLLSPLDPAAWAGATLVLAGIALLAVWLPARRAAGVPAAAALATD